MAYLKRKRGSDSPDQYIVVDYGKVPLRHRRPKFGVPGNGILGEYCGVDPEEGCTETVYATDGQGNRVGRPLYREYKEKPPWSRNRRSR